MPGVDVISGKVENAINDALGEISLNDLVRAEKGGEF
jgi:hypothetical protein